MPSLDGRIRIDAPVEKVFDFVDDWRNTTRFIHGLVRWKPLDPGNVQGEGARFRAAMKVGPSVLEGEMEVVEHVPNERVVFVSTRGPQVRGEWTFHAEGDGTLVDLRNTFTLPGGVVGRVVGKVISGQGRKALDDSLADLKRLVEGGD